MTFEVQPVLTVRLPRLPGPSRRRAMEAALAEVERLHDAHERVYLRDAWGLDRNKADLDFIAKASRGRDVWVDAGARYATDVMDQLIAGARHVVVRWSTVAAAGEVAEAAEMSHALSLGLEFQGPALVQNPRAPGADADDLVRLARQHGLGVAVVALTRGDAVERPRAVATQVRHFHGDRRFVGPLATPAARGELADLGYDGVFVDAKLLEAGANV